MPTPKTVQSGTTSYCTVAQFLDRYDVRTVSDLLADDNTRVVPLPVDRTTRLQHLLNSGAGKIERAAVAGRRYTPDDLAALAGFNGGEDLADLNAGVTFDILWTRRPDVVVHPQMQQKSQLALKDLEDLRMGLQIFPFQETAIAGSSMVHPHHAKPNISTQVSRYLGTIGRHDDFPD